MIRTDCKANEFIAKTLVEKVIPIFRANADCEESFWIDDIMFSAGTEDKFVGVPCECKVLKGGYQFKYDGDWNTYFTIGIYNKLNFHKEPPEVGTPIYFINAVDKLGNYKNGKFQKILDNKASLVFLSPDCILFYTAKMLERAFCGYADYYVKHTSEFDDRNRSWETKAIIDLNKGLYIPCDPPSELFYK